MYINKLAIKRMKSSEEISRNSFLRIQRVFVTVIFPHFGNKVTTVRRLSSYARMGALS